MCEAAINSHQVCTACTRIDDRSLLSAIEAHLEEFAAVLRARSVEDLPVSNQFSLFSDIVDEAAGLREELVPLAAQAASLLEEFEGAPRDPAVRHLAQSLLPALRLELRELGTRFENQLMAATTLLSNLRAATV